MRYLISCVLGLVLGMATAAAHDGPLDPRFGDGGMRNYGFQSFNGSGRADKATATCPGPDGTLLVVGEASDARRIVTMRLLPNGDYDPSFGAAGRATLDFPMTPEPLMAGLCQSDGKILLARRLRVGVNNEMNVQLLRINAANGQIDASFGQGGSIVLDLDTWQSGLSAREAPFALVALDQGEALLLGQTATSTRLVAFAARIRADGSVPIARVYTDVAGRATANAWMSATLAGDGTIWGIVEGKQPGSDRITPFRVRFDRNTLGWIDVPDALPDAKGNHIYSGIGVVVRPGVLAVPVLQEVAGTPPIRLTPGLMVFRATGKVYVPLPDPSLPGESLSFKADYAYQAATRLSGNRVLFAATTTRLGESAGYGVHAALVEIGSAAGQDRIDTAFGTGGAQTAAFRPVGGSCAAALVKHDMKALTIWSGLPVFVGTVDASCANPDANTDYLVGRLYVDRIFGAGFE